jgi:Lon protease-like protein
MMVRDTREKGQPLIGMALLRGDWQAQYEGNPDIFPIGCAGEMARVVPVQDGRFNILLNGSRVYRITEEVLEKPYRQAVVEWQPEARGALTPEQRQDLSTLLETYLQKNEAVHKFLSDPSIEDDLLVNFFAFHLDFLPIEKQSLLEAPSIPDRATLLRDMLDFKLAANRWQTGGQGGSGKSGMH